MSNESAAKPYQLLQIENHRLKERVRELEAKVKAATGVSTNQSLHKQKADSRMFELVKHKDKALSEYSDRMEQKAHELERLVQELNSRNEELANGMAVLRLYQMMFENEPTGILGMDKDGRIIQFNSAAVKYFGVTLHAMRLRPVGELKVEGSEVFDFEELFEKAIDSDTDVVEQIKVGEDLLELCCYRLDDASGLRGIVMRISKS
ncbi:MAG: PAS domain-containing protein [Planctomycetota bacterium]|jgi:PAS domain-containing protein